MRFSRHLSLILTLVLMLCGQTVSAALMWCCPGSEHTHAVAQDQHSVMSESHHHQVMNHLHELSASDMQTDEQLHVDDADNWLSCAHDCAGSCSYSAPLTESTATQVVVSLPVEDWFLSPRSPQAQPSLPFRPPIAL